MNKGCVANCIILTLLFASSSVHAQKAATEKPAARPESFLEKVLRITGISANPTTLKGPGDEVTTGEVWLAELSSKRNRRLTATGGYRSPIFLPNADLLALRRTDVVRLTITDPQPRMLYSIPDASKLVGFSQANPDQVLMLLEDAAGDTSVGLLSVASGKVSPLPYDLKSESDRQMVEHLAGWTRNYGDVTVYVKHQTKQAISGPLDWTDVFLRSGAAPAVDVSQCSPVNCGQPSLSADRHLLVFIRSDQD